jgi:hypothetical protein
MRLICRLVEYRPAYRCVAGISEPIGRLDLGVNPITEVQSLNPHGS